MKLLVKQRVFSWTDSYDVYDENEENPEYADVEVDTEAENETEANVQPEEDGEEA